MNASVRSRLELPSPRGPHGLLLALLAAAALVGVLLSDLPAALALALWALAFGTSALGLARQPRAIALLREPNGSLAVEYANGAGVLRYAGHRRYGPWMILLALDNNEALRRIALLPFQLPAERRRQLLRMLAAGRPAPAVSV